MPKKRYVAQLTDDERDFLTQLISSKGVAAQKRTRAQVLLKADAGPQGPGWIDQRIAEAFDVTSRTVENVRRRLVEEGLEAAISRKPKYTVRTRRRRRPRNVKEAIVIEREYKNIRLGSEQVSEFAYRPTACKKTYRMVVVRKNLSVERGERKLFDDIRYFFYITNDWRKSGDKIVASANQRCNQENLNAQLLNGVRAMRMPADNLVSNWAYMVMAAQAWTMKAWLALLLPAKGRWKKKHKAEKQAVLRMEFKTFLNEFMRVPCRIVRTGRRIIYRLLSWNRWQHVFLRAVDAVRYPLRC